MSRSAVDNVLDQVGYCGIWCGSCAVGTGALMRIAEKYLGLAESHGLEHWGAAGFDYGALRSGLEAIAALDVCPGCLRGGGRDDCEIRSCASARGLRGCVECSERDACPHFATLAHMRSGASAAGLFVAERAEDHTPSEDFRRDVLRSLWWWRAVVDEDA
jgi:hypothetical protein